MPGHENEALWTSSTECGEESADIEEVEEAIASFNRLENTELFDKLRGMNTHASEVFELRLFGGLVLRDIAVILGRTEYDTRSLWNEALSLMKEWSDESV